MKSGTLIAVNGAIYEYLKYEKEFGVHIVATVQIDQDGILTHTCLLASLSEEEFSRIDKKQQFTKQQWYGIVEHFIRQLYEMTDEEIAEATEDIVERCFAHGIPKFHELEDFIIDYMDR